MDPYVAEFVGTAILVLLGCGVCANVNLRKTNGHDSGWIVISFGWGMAVFVAVACTGEYSGAHLNPAVTLGLALEGFFPWSRVAGYMAGQFAGAFLGAVLVWLCYYQHFQESHEDPAAMKGVFCTGPAIRKPAWNLLTEVIGTLVLVLGVLYFTGAAADAPSGEIPLGLGSLGALPSGLLVLAIGLSLGGPTGYAINPARDFCPRLVHAILPLSGKGDSDWSYAWVPIVGPLMGGAIAAVVVEFVGR